MASGTTRLALEEKVDVSANKLSDRGICTVGSSYRVIR